MGAGACCNKNKKKTASSFVRLNRVAVYNEPETEYKFKKHM
jgi:hypothetical protein